MSYKNIKKILIIRFGAIGDVVHSTELYRSLKRYNSDLSIHYLTFKTPALLLEKDPDLSRVWILEEKSYKYLKNFSKILKKEKFDLVINLHPSIRTRIFTFWINAKHNLTYKKNFKRHAVENFWETAKPLFKNIELNKKLKLFLPKETIKRISGFINKDKKIIGFNPGASASRQGRKWSVKYWQELAELLIDKYKCEIIIAGSKEDADTAKKLVNISPAIKSFCGEFNIAESAALLSRCDLVISSDTGPLHIATALGVPVIGLYGAAPILRTGPYGNSNYAISSDRKCVPCNRRKCKYIKKDETNSPCMEDITPEKILKIIENDLLLFSNG